MESVLLKKLGIEKAKVVKIKFDDVYEKYSNKAIELGYKGNLKFITEKGKVLIYVTL